MAVSDVYNLIVRGTLFGQEIINSYFYQQRTPVITIGETIAGALVDQWVSQIMGPVTAVQSADYIVVDVKCDNLFDVADSADGTLSYPGTWGGGGNTDSAFTALGFDLDVVGRAVRRGHKRLAGITEDVSTDGVVTNGTYITAANAAASAMLRPVTNGAFIPIDTWYPIVVKRVRSGTRPDFHYRLPLTLLETVLQDITNVTARLILTSQVSRKIGRGA